VASEAQRENVGETKQHPKPQKAGPSNIAEKAKLTHHGAPNPSGQRDETFALCHYHPVQHKNKVLYAYCHGCTGTPSLAIVR
jgi:hypothetical protein